MGDPLKITCEDGTRMTYSGINCTEHLGSTTTECSEHMNNPLKPEVQQKNIYKFSSYLTGNTIRLRYKTPIR
jgi:hypothetical protein